MLVLPLLQPHTIPVDISFAVNVESAAVIVFLAGHTRTGVSPSRIIVHAILAGDMRDKSLIQLRETTATLTNDVQRFTSAFAGIVDDATLNSINEALSGVGEHKLFTDIDSTDLGIYTE